MDKRSVIALVLIALVIVAGPLLMPRSPETANPADTTRARDSVAHRDSAVAPATAATVTPSVAKRAAAPSVPVAVRESSGIPAETLAVNAPERVTRFVSAG